MPNGTGEERDQWSAIHRIEIAATRIEQAVSDHISNQSLHPSRPCQDLRDSRDDIERIDRRMWAAVIAGFGAAVAFIMQLVISVVGTK